MELRLVDLFTAMEHEVPVGQDSVIGRSRKSDIVIPDSGYWNPIVMNLADSNISENHATIHGCADGTARVWDNGSTNGTYLNGEKLRVGRNGEGDQHFVREGDRIKLGEYELIFKAGG